jgi:hypothetical protein
MSQPAPKPLLLVCGRCSFRIRGLAAADVPERGIVCRCGHRLLPGNLRVDHQRLRRAAPKFGPGTELTALLAELGITDFRGCGCASKARQMDRWGVAGCRQHFGTIRGWLVEAMQKASWTSKLSAALLAAKTGLALSIDPTDIPGSLAELAIAREEAASEKRNAAAADSQSTSAEATCARGACQRG